MRKAKTVRETPVSPAPAAQFTPGLVLEVGEDGVIVAACPHVGREAVPCSLLCTSEGQGLVLARGDAVLVWLACPDDAHGVVLGRVGPTHAAPEAEQVPDEIVIEAKQQLTLKCGEGSITLRGDGKVLIRGKDLVSHAQRMNRVKGGAVAIN